VPLYLRQYLPVLKDVWRLAIPVIFTNLLQTLVNVIDIFMVGRLGPLDVAAVGMAQVIRMLVLVGVLSVTAGSMALAAQAVGQRDDRRLRFVTRQSLMLALLIGIGLSLFGLIFAEYIMQFLGGDSSPEVVAMGASYLNIFFLGGAFLTLNFAINALMQGAGDTVTPLILVGIINAINVLMNYLLMFGPGPFPALGLDGAAIGTVIARGLGATAGIVLFYSGRNIIKLKGFDYRPNWQMFKDILGIGVPSGLQGIARNLTQIFVLRIVTATPAAAFGAAALAIGSQIESLATMPVLGINVAATALIGQSLGAWQVDEAKRRGAVAIGFSILVMLVLSLPMLIFAPQLVILFEPSANPTILSAGTAYLRIDGLSYIFVAIAMVTNGALRGAGDTIPGLMVTIIGRWFVTIPLAFVLALVLDFGINGVWIAIAIGNVVQGSLILVRWSRQKWLQVALRKTELYRTHLAPLPHTVQQQFLEELRTPLMKQAGVREKVDEEGVTYTTAKAPVRVKFAQDGYQILGGSLRGAQGD
jgi:putative MATE family efflux protein